MDFRGSDPGAVQYGNFINYYQFNSAEDRIKLLPSHIWNTNADPSVPYLVLDVGCNSGTLTKLLYEFLIKHTKRRVVILGVDIDRSLIERAKESIESDDIHFECVDMMNEQVQNRITSFLAQHNTMVFDAVFCLSISMWIHLNHGDEGLQRFLEKCSKLSLLLILEPQPWKCYQTAVKRLRKAKDTFNFFTQLKWRSDIEHQINTHLVEKLKCSLDYNAEPTKWNRKICIYRTTNKT